MRNNSNFRKLSIATLAFFAFCLCCGFTFLFARSSHSQTETRNIKIEDWPQAYQNKEPVKILGLYLGTTQLKSGEDFQADKDWLRDLRLMVKNVSDQPIRQITLWLDLPMNNLPISDPNFQQRRIEIHYGRGYWTTRTPVESVPELLLAPGETATFGYNTNNSGSFDHLVSHLSKDHNHDFLPSKGWVSLGAVVFENIDTGWTMTRYVIRRGNEWVGDPAKVHLNGGRQQSRNTGTTKSNGLLKAFIGGKPASTCYDIPSYPDPLSTQEFCTVCPDCKYIKPIIVTKTPAFYRVQSSFPCYHTVLGVID